MSNAQERTPLLESSYSQELVTPSDHHKTRRHLASGLVILFVVAIIVAAVITGDGLPNDPNKAAIVVLEGSPVIVSDRPLTFDRLMLP